MGLDTSHDCWHGAYSAFNRWRDKLAEVAGYGDLSGYVGHGGVKPFPGRSALETLLDHSYCDGEIAAADCAPLADALELLLPALAIAGEGGGHIGNYVQKTEQFIAGLRDAAENHESVDFH